MTDLSSDHHTALLRVMTFLSPAFPTGSFAWSGGLEWACSNGQVHDQASLLLWITDSLQHGPMWNDSVICAAAWRGEEQANEIALAMAGSKERYEEQISLGAAFARAVAPWRGESVEALPEPIALSFAVGRLGAEQSLPLESLLTGFLQSAVSNQIQAALRLFSLGQKAGLEVTRQLETEILKCAAKASVSSLDDIGSAAVMIDVAVMKHETQTSRIFRS